MRDVIAGFLTLVALVLSATLRHASMPGPAPRPPEQTPPAIVQRGRRRVFPFVPLIAAALLLGVSAWALVSSLTDEGTRGSGSPSQPAPTRLSDSDLAQAPWLGNTNVAPLTFPGLSSQVAVGVSVNSIDDSTQTISVSMSASMGQDLQHNILKLNNVHRGTVCGNQPRYSWKYAGAAVTIQVVGDSPFFVAYYHEALADLLCHGSHQIDIAAAPATPSTPNWPLNGSNRLYPLNVVGLSAQTYVVMPPGVKAGTCPNPTECPDPGDLPLVLFGQLTSGSKFADRRVAWAQQSYSCPLALRPCPPTTRAGMNRWASTITDGGYVRLAVRWDETKWYVLALSLVPFILGLVLIDLLYLGRRSKDESSTASLRDFALGLGAIVLAILPLHAVLVPMSIQQLTLIDFILGGEILLLICVAVVAYFFVASRATESSGA